MTRILKFGTTEEDAERFRYVHLGFTLGGNMLHRNGEKRERDVRANEATILRQLKAISREKESGENGGKERELLADGGEVRIDQKQHELLMKYIAAAPFLTEVSDSVDEALDWVSAAPEDKKKAEAPATPTAAVD